MSPSRVPVSYCPPALKPCALLALALLCACNPGELADPNEVDDLQTRRFETDMRDNNSDPIEMGAADMSTPDMKPEEDMRPPKEDMEPPEEDMKPMEDMRVCIPLTAADCGNKCGMQSDGCTSMINCGQCPPEDCDNGRDDDNDGMSDCDDVADCGTLLHCQGTEICNNNMDDDGDGLADCQDIECRSFGACDDGLDCKWKQLTTRNTTFHTVTQANPQYSLNPIANTESFACLRVEFDMQTVNNLQQTANQNTGCPLNSHILAVIGRDAGANSKILADAYFQFMNSNCSTGKQVARLENWVTFDSKLSGAYAPGKTYRVVLEIKPFVSEMQLYEMGTRAGPVLSASIEGTNLQDSNNPIIRFGLDAIADETHFPYYGASYSNLQIWADAFPTPNP